MQCKVSVISQRGISRKSTKSSLRCQSSKGGSACEDNVGIIDSFNDNPVALSRNQRDPARSRSSRRVAWLCSFHEFDNLKFEFKQVILFKMW
jgi:hypothetical protein